MKRTLVALTAALAIPASALGADAEPKRYALSATIQPGDTVALAVGAVPRGRFAWSVAASSTARKNFSITQQRPGKREIRVLRVPSQPAYDVCSGGSESVYGLANVLCSKVTSPIVTKARYTFRIRNHGEQPLKVGIVIKWQR